MQGKDEERACTQATMQYGCTKQSTIHHRLQHDGSVVAVIAPCQKLNDTLQAGMSGPACDYAYN